MVVVLVKVVLLSFGKSVINFFGDYATLSHVVGNLVVVVVNVRTLDGCRVVPSKFCLAFLYALLRRFGENWGGGLFWLGGGRLF